MLGVVRCMYTLNNVGYLKRTFSTITMLPQENPARVPQGLHGNSTQGFLPNNLYCLECVYFKPFDWRNRRVQVQNNYCRYVIAAVNSLLILYNI